MGLYSQPSAPDPNATAAAQFNYNIGATQASGIVNNPNTSDPYGSTTYSLSGYETVNLPDGQQIQVPRYNQTTSLTPQGQRILDQQRTLGNKSFNRAAAILGRPSGKGAVPWDRSYDTGNLRTGFRGNTGTRTFDTAANRRNVNMIENGRTSSFNPLKPLAGDVQTEYADPAEFEASRARVENAAFRRASGLLNESRDSEVARLAAMGLTPGGAAYGRVADQFERSGNDLALQAVLAGGQEQSRLLGEARSAGQFANAANAQEFAQRSGLISAENARRMSEVNLHNTANQAEFAMRTALTQMENARRTGDMQAYNKALESYNNTQLAQTQINRDQANFNNNLRTAQVGEREAIKNAEINRLIGILSGAQVQNPTIPGYFTQGVGAPDYSGLVQNNYNQQVGSYNAALGGVADLAGAGIGWLTGRPR